MVSGFLSEQNINVMLLSISYVAALTVFKLPSSMNYKTKIEMNRQNKKQTD